MGLGAFLSWIVIFSPGWRATFSPLLLVPLSHIFTLRGFHAAGKAPAAPHQPHLRREKKRASGKCLRYLKLSKTSLTKCYFGMNTCCRFTSVRGTADATAPIPNIASRRRRHTRPCVCRVSARTDPRLSKCPSTQPRPDCRFSPALESRAQVKILPGVSFPPSLASLPPARSVRRHNHRHNLLAAPEEKETGDADLPRSRSNTGI